MDKQTLKKANELNEQINALKTQKEYWEGTLKEEVGCWSVGSGLGEIKITLKREDFEPIVKHLISGYAGVLDGFEKKFEQLKAKNP